MEDARPQSTTQSVPSNEQALLERLRARDQTALSALYDRYSGVVYALAFRITSSTVEASSPLGRLHYVTLSATASFKLNTQQRIASIGPSA